MLQIGEPSLEADLPKYDVQLVGEDNPRAIVNIVPGELRDAIYELIKTHPQYLNLSEVQLNMEINPTELDDRLRLGFWNEYARAQDGHRQMKIKNICGMFCNREYFYYKVLTNPQRLAWILKQPEEYMTSLEASLNHGKNQIDKLMKMALFDDKKNLKIKEAKVFLQAYALLDARVKGAVLQRIEQKSATLHLHKKLEGDSSAVADLQNEIEAEVVNGKD